MGKELWRARCETVCPCRVGSWLCWSPWRRRKHCSETQLTERQPTLNSPSKNIGLSQNRMQDKAQEKLNPDLNSVRRLANRRGTSWFRQSLLNESLSPHLRNAIVKTCPGWEECNVGHQKYWYVDHLCYLHHWVHTNTIESGRSPLLQG